MAVTGYPFYSPFYSVGKGKQNSSTDVMLVQYMLFYTMVGADSGWRFPYGPTLMQDISPDAIFPFDGVWRPDLEGWIYGFQKYTAPKLGYACTADGVINRMPAYWADKVGHRKVYTIQVLNAGMIRANREQFMTLPEVSNVPGPLASELKTVRFEAFEGLGA